jgi:hypothetical protein
MLDSKNSNFNQILIQDKFIDEFIQKFMALYKNQTNIDDILNDKDFKQAEVDIEELEKKLKNIFNNDISVTENNLEQNSLTNFKQKINEIFKSNKDVDTIKNMINDIGNVNQNSNNTKGQETTTETTNNPDKEQTVTKVQDNANNQQDPKKIQIIKSNIKKVLNRQTSTLEDMKTAINNILIKAEIEELIEKNILDHGLKKDANMLLSRYLPLISEPLTTFDVELGQMQQSFNESINSNNTAAIVESEYNRLYKGPKNFIRKFFTFKTEQELKDNITKVVTNRQKTLSNFTKFIDEKNVTITGTQSKVNLQHIMGGGRIFFSFKDKNTAIEALDNIAGGSIRFMANPGVGTHGFTQNKDGTVIEKKLGFFESVKNYLKFKFGSHKTWFGKTNQEKKFEYNDSFQCRIPLACYNGDDKVPNLGGNYGEMYIHLMTEKNGQCHVQIGCEAKGVDSSEHSWSGASSTLGALGNKKTSELRQELVEELIAKLFVSITQKENDVIKTSIEGIKDIFNKPNTAESYIEAVKQQTCTIPLLQDNNTLIEKYCQQIASLPLSKYNAYRTATVISSEHKITQQNTHPHSHNHVANLQTQHKDPRLGRGH